MYHVSYITYYHIQLHPYTTISRKMNIQSGDVCQLEFGAYSPYSNLVNNTFLSINGGDVTGIEAVCDNTEESIHCEGEGELRKVPDLMQKAQEYRIAFLSFIAMSNISLMYILVLLTRMAKKYGIWNTGSDEARDDNNKEEEEGEEPRREVPVKLRPPPIDIRREIPEKFNNINVQSQMHHHGDRSYKRACKLSYMIMTLINEYMSDWFRKVTEGDEEKVIMWHPYVLLNDIDISGYIMVRVLNTRMRELSNGMIEYISVIISSVIFHGLLRGPKQVMTDVQDLYKLKLPVNCVSSYNIRLLRSYNKETLKKAYYNHIEMVKENADERMKTKYFEKQLDTDKSKAYNDELKKMILHVLAEINWRSILVDLSDNYVDWDVEESESDYCISPRRESSEIEDDVRYRRSYL